MKVYKLGIDPGSNKIEAVVLCVAIGHCENYQKHAK